jgi:uncharacterized protein (DUF4415 family)
MREWQESSPKAASNNNIGTSTVANRSRIANNNHNTTNIGKNSQDKKSLIKIEAGGSAKFPKKVTVSLALDASIVEKIKSQSASMNQSFNSRINEILEKYVNFFITIEEFRSAVIPQSLHQFFLNEIDEEKYTAKLKQIGTEVIQGMFVRSGMAPTLDKMIEFVFETICVNGGSIRSVKRYIDEGDGRTCLYFTHDYDTKWSRILSAAFAHHIQTELHLHTMTEVFFEGFEIKIIGNNPA